MCFANNTIGKMEEWKIGSLDNPFHSSTLPKKKRYERKEEYNYHQRR